MQTCSWCGGNYDPIDCPYFFNTYIYNPARGNYQNSLWSYNHHVIEPQNFVSQEKMSSLEEIMKSLNRTFENFMEFSHSLQSNSKIDHEEQIEEIISGQPQEFFEEVEAHEDEGSSIKEVEAYDKEEESYKEDLKWLIDYYEKKLVSNFTIQKT